MDGMSGPAKAGKILLLIAGIVGLVFGLLVLGAGIYLRTAGENLFGGETPSTFSTGVIGVIYIVMGALQVVGGIFAFLGHARAARGDVRGAWTLGLVAGLLPPVQVVPMVGAILCLVSPEAKGAAA